MELLERDASLRRLDATLNDAANSAGCVALVSGEAGIGKTSLVSRFVREHRESVRVLWGACDAQFTPRPLGPLHDMVAQIQGSLAKLLNEDLDRNAIFSAVLSALHGPPVITVVEDIHWADEATLDLLRFLGRRIAKTRALLVLTYRDDELGPCHPLRTALGDLASSPAAHRIALAPLSSQAVRTMIGTRAIDACALHHQTGGNPFFVTEVLDSDGTFLPATVRDVVLARAAQLSPSARAILQAAAVIGPRIEPWVLTQISAADAPVVDECLDSGMLVAQGELLAFRHELARQTVLLSISPLHKSALHRSTLAALQAAPTARTDVARLAHHAEAARDHAAVLAYAPVAAQQAAAAGAHRQAAALYALALRFADDLPPADHARLLERSAQAHYVIDQRDTGVALLRAALQRWRAVGDTCREGATLAHMAKLMIGLGHDGEADRCSRAALGILEAHPGSDELAHAYLVQATLDMIDHNHYAARGWAEKSSALAARFPNSAEHFSAQNIIGSTWMYLEYERGCRHLERSLAAAHAAGQTATTVHAYAQLGSISSELNCFREADTYLSDGLVYASRHDLDRLRSYMQAWQAWTRLHLGAWTDAADLAGVVLKNSSMPNASRLMALVTLGRLQSRRGDPGAAVLLDEALEVAQHMRNIDRLGPLYTARAEAAWLAGDRDRTIAEARVVYELAVSKQHPWFAGELAFWRWRAGDEVVLPVWAAKPFALHIGGDVRAAAAEWHRLGCPYEHARALADSAGDMRTAALSIFERLGAQPAALELRRNLRIGGARRIPRGPQASTRANPYGLTARQMDILRLLSAGLSNAEIAVRLFISPKTVDHHVCAVLARLDVDSRRAAAALMRQHPLLNQGAGVPATPIASPHV